MLNEQRQRKTESVMFQEPKKINIRQLTDQWIEEIRADLSPNVSEESRGKIVSARLNERIRATMAADPEFEQAFIQSDLENDPYYVEALIREYITDTRLVDPEDPEVSEDTLIENALWALAEIEGPAEQLKLLRELFEKLQSALTSATGSPFVDFILTPIISRLKDAIVYLQEYFRTKYYDNYNATFRPQTSYIEAVIDQFIMSYYLFSLSYELESRTSERRDQKDSKL
jgi:hypothetical protein